MSIVVYGIDAQDGLGQDSWLSIVDTGAGIWSQLAVITGLANTYFPTGLVWNPVNSTMYLVASSYSSSQVYTIDLTSAVATLVANITPASMDYNANYISGLTFDTSTNTCYCVNPTDPFTSFNGTYTLNLSTGQLTRVGIPLWDSRRKVALAYDPVADNLKGLAVDGITTGQKLQMMDVDRTSGVWSNPQDTGQFFQFRNLDTVVPQAMTFWLESMMLQKYGACLDMADACNSFTINNDGSWTFVGNALTTGVTAALAAATIQICVAEGTQVSVLVEDGTVKERSIEQLKLGDRLLADRQADVSLLGLIRIPMVEPRLEKISRSQLGRQCPKRDVLIARGHPIKIRENVILPETVSKTIPVPKGGYLYTLITEERTFVDMSGLLVQTWSWDAWQNFIENDIRGKNLKWELIK